MQISFSESFVSMLKYASQIDFMRRFYEGYVFIEQ